jgi:negative regulator of sigma E activity
VGNLGPYQDFVTNAKAAGGVEKLIESIEKSAAMKAMPKAFAAGVGVTAAATLGVTAIVRRYSERSDAQEAEADFAKAELRRNSVRDPVDDVQSSEDDEAEVHDASGRPAGPDENS